MDNGATVLDILSAAIILSVGRSEALPERLSGDVPECKEKVLQR